MITTEDPRIIRYPHPCKIHVRYEEMRIGDVWCTTSNLPISVGIKRKTWGWGSMFSLEKCSHVAMVTRIGDQYFLVEALGKGVMISTCYRYLNPGPWNGGLQVCAMMRHVNMDSQYYDFINKQLISLAWDNAPYDTNGALEFQFPFLHESSLKLFCSEMADVVYLNTEVSQGLPSGELIIVQPARPSSKVTPRDFQLSRTMVDVSRRVKRG